MHNSVISCITIGHNFAAIEVHTTNDISEAIWVTVVLNLVDLLSRSNSIVLTSYDNTVVVILSSCTRCTSTSTFSRQVVGYIYTEAVNVVQHETVLETSTTEVAVKHTGVFVFQHLYEYWIKNNPTTTSVYVCCVQLTSHTCKYSQRGNSCSRQCCCAWETWCQWHGVTCSSRTSNGQVTEVSCVKVVCSEQFTSQTSSTLCITRSSCDELTSSCVTGQVRHYVSVHCVGHFVCCTISCQSDMVDVGELLFDVIHFECEVVSLVDSQREVGIVELLSSDGGVALQSVDGYVWLFLDTNSIALVSNLTEVIVVCDCVCDGSFAKSNLRLLGVDNRGEVPVKAARCGCNSHD
eukprot:g2697.t1